MKIKIYGSAFLTALFVSLIFIFERALVKTIDFLTLGFLISFISIIYLFVFIITSDTPDSLKLAKIGKRMAWLIIIGVFNFVYYFSTLLGLKYSTATNAAIIQRSDIFFTVILSHFLIREKIFLWNYIGMIIMIIGYVFVMGISFKYPGNIFMGDLLFLLGGFILAFNAIVIKRLSEYLKDEVIAFYNVSTATVLFAIFMFLNGWPDFTEVFQGKSKPFLILLTGLIGGVSYQTYCFLVKSFPVWLIRMPMLLVPIITLIIGVTFIGERISGLQALGIILILAGLFLIIINREQTEKNKEMRIRYC